MRLLPSAVKTAAEELSLEVYQPERIRSEEPQARIRELNPDAMVVVAYGQILPAPLINAPRLGTLNVHASLLPRHRGPAPIEWAILNGDAETGVTIMQMDAGVDTGPILSQQQTPIGRDETAQDLERRLAELGAGLLVETLGNLEQGLIHSRAQPSEGASHAPRLKSEDGKLDPATMSADEIDRRVRALGERVGVWLALNGVELKVFRGHPAGDGSEGVRVPTIRGVYVVDEVQAPGGRRMPAAAWGRGRR
jgi:methionyl-tRNA formyltransferase